MVVDKRNPVLQHLSLEELQLRVSEELSSMKSLKVRLYIPFGIANNIIMYSKLHRPLKQSSVNTQVKDVVSWYDFT